MIRVLRSVVLAALVLSACGPVSREATPLPSFPPPSNACGGFRLTVVNRDDVTLLVNLNGTTYATVEPDQSATLIQFLTPGVPPMPWAMSVVDGSDGTHRVSATLTGDQADEEITVSAESVSHGPGSCRPDELTDAVPAEGPWGPLALVLRGNGEKALTSGVLEITETCVFLTRDERTLLIWPAAQTKWQPATHTVLFTNRDGQLHPLANGQRVSIGGGGGGRDEGELVAQLDLPWVVPPMPECAAPSYWFVGDVAN